MMNMMMGFIQEKVETFLAPILAFLLRLCPKSDPSSRSHLPQLQPSSPPSPNVANAESPVSLPLPPPSSPSFSLESEPINLLAAQQHLQWQNAILTFCFTFALGLISLQFSQTDKSKELPTSFALLSFAILLTFFLLLVAFFINQRHATTSIKLEKVALLLAAAAFCHAITIPFPLNLKFASWTLFFFSVFVIVICKFLYGNIAS
ncbi:hypothetical protein REPUB_Repub20aG0026500 [Reevesia pubescens]